MTLSKHSTKHGEFAFGLSLMSILERYGARFAPETGEGGAGDESDVEDDEPEYLDNEAGDDAFLKNLGDDDASTPDPKEGEGEGDETDPQEPEQEQPEGEQEADEKTPPSEASDDATVSIKVGEETHKVAVKDLKRLFGQEAALTKRSQEVATEREAIRQSAELNSQVLAKALERAEARFKPYAELDLLVLSKEMDAETLKQLRKDGQEAFEEVRFFREELQNAQTRVREAAAKQQQEAAAEAIRQLTDKDHANYIEGWSQSMYEELRTFAKAEGLSEFDRMTDPVAMRLIRMAMLYKNGKKVAELKVKAAVRQPSKPLKPGGANSKTADERDSEGAMKRLARTGAAADAEAAFLARLR